MKKKKNILVICLLLILIVFLGYNGVFNKLKNNFKNILDNNLVASDIDLASWTANGLLVNEDDLNSLNDSGISGEEYTFDSLYYPYFSMLSENQQNLYKQVYANALNLSKTFVPQVGITVSEVSDVVEAVYNDHPELFWVDTSYSYKYTKSGKCVQITLNFNALSSNIDQAKTYFNSKANSIIQRANTLSSDYEKEKYVHDAILELAEYDENAALSQSAYSALVNGKTVCAGYARAFQYIMIKLQIPTYFVVGYAQEDHGWNLVKLSDGFYNVDLTWDDDNNDSYAYFNKTDADFSLNHTRLGMSVNLPSAYGTEYRYNSNSDVHVIYYTDQVPQNNESESQESSIDNYEEYEESSSQSNIEIQPDDEEITIIPEEEKTYSNEFSSYNKSSIESGY